MIESIYNYTQTESTLVEKIIMDENIHYIHMVFEKGKGLPEHNANSNVYMTVLKGRLSLTLNEQETHVYGAGKIVVIPNGTKMNVQNQDSDLLELIVIKGPAPK